MICGGKSMKRQRGISMVGFIIILVIAAFFAYTLMKLVPAYMDYFSVSKALTTVATNAQSADMSVGEVRRQLDTQELSQYFSDADITQGDIKVVRKPNGGRQLQLRYDKQIPWIYNIDFLLHFEKTAPLKAPAQ
jgi:hypothetical protein